MKRFENAQVGDRVYCRLNGDGIIDSINGKDFYAVDCSFEDAKESYSFDGKFRKQDKEPTLFYIDGDNLYATERPKPTLKASMLPVDTKVMAGEKKGDSPRFFAGLGASKIGCFVNGRSLFSNEGIELNYWNFAELAEETTINGITYAAGTKIEAG